MRQIIKFNLQRGSHPQKTFNVAQCPTAIRKEGGPANVQKQLESGDAKDIIDFLMSFPGCGPKYARNIMMDVYDERFHEGCFAIDSRIKSLFPRLKYPGKDKY